MPAGPKKKRNQDDTRAKLLKAALDVFSKVGFDAATTRDISKKAGVNESLIHRYFESKQGLFLALKKQFRENFIRQFLEYDESGNIKEELIKFMRSRLQLNKKDKKFFRLAISRAILDPKSREEIRSYANMKPPELLERFARFRRIGQIRPEVDLDQLIGVLHSLTFAFGVLTDGMECMDPAETEDLIASAASLLTDGLAPRPRTRQ